MKLFVGTFFLGASGSCDIAGCFDRCRSKFPGSGEPYEDQTNKDAYMCSKGCAKVTGHAIEDKDYFCDVEKSERFDFCSDFCGTSGVSEDEEYQEKCRYGCGFWKTSPSPSPAPSPTPSPSPGNLPDIPDVDIWVGFWGARKAMYDDASLAFDYSGPAYKTSQIEKHGGGGLRFLYPAFMFFCEEEEMTNTCTLKDDYEDQWNDAVPEMTQLLKDGKIIGFTVGDERVCTDGGHGTSVKHLTKMIDTIRDSFPDRKKAIIHYNECGHTFGHFKDGKCEDDAAMTDVPSGLDWISIDHYRGSKEKDGFMDDLKDYHKKCIYPKMHSQQRICITTGTTSEVCPNEKTCLQDAKYAVEWAESDGKVACITPYRWDDMDDLDDGKWSDLKDYWTKYARKSRPGMQNATVV